MRAHLCAVWVLCAPLAQATDFSIGLNGHASQATEMRMISQTNDHYDGPGIGLLLQVQQIQLFKPAFRVSYELKHKRLAYQGTLTDPWGKEVAGELKSKVKPRSHAAQSLVGWAIPIYHHGWFVPMAGYRLEKNTQTLLNWRAKRSVHFASIGAILESHRGPNKGIGFEALFHVPLSGRINMDEATESVPIQHQVGVDLKAHWNQLDNQQRLTWQYSPYLSVRSSEQGPLVPGKCFADQSVYAPASNQVETGLVISYHWHH